MKRKTITLKKYPYTIVGGMSYGIPRNSILLKGKGLKFIANKIKDSDLVRITCWSDITKECEKQKHYQKIEIIKCSSK